MKIFSLGFLIPFFSFIAFLLGLSYLSTLLVIRHQIFFLTCSYSISILIIIVSLVLPLWFIVIHRVVFFLLVLLLIFGLLLDFWADPFIFFFMTPSTLGNLSLFLRLITWIFLTPHFIYLYCILFQYFTVFM